MFGKALLLAVAAVAAHQAGLRGICAKWGLGFRSLTTDEPLDGVLYDFLKTRTESGPRTKRRRER